MGIVEDLMKKGKLKSAVFSDEMLLKEYQAGQSDLESAKSSLSQGNFKWATIQAYYGVFHGMRALVYKEGLREESHSAIKAILRERYTGVGRLSIETYNTFERGMNLREMADYKNTFSESAAQKLVESVEKAMIEIEALL